MEYEVLTSVHGTELFHILFAQLKVEYLKVCLHAFNVIGLRNNSDAALDHITKCDLTSGLAVFFGDLDNTRIAEHLSGKHTSNHCIYGYKKDPNDKDHWIIDEEAAEVVRRIYRMAIEGKGPYEIARILATEKVERPSYYLAQRGMGNHQSNYNAADPYTWRGGTVADILSKQEYMGHMLRCSRSKLQRKT